MKHLVMRKIKWAKKKLNDRNKNNLKIQNKLSHKLIKVVTSLSFEKKNYPKLELMRKYPECVATLKQSLVVIENKQETICMQ